MTLTAIIAAITSISTIVGGFVYMWKQSLWIFSKSPDAQTQAANQTIQTSEQQAEQTGRPS